MCLSPAYNEGGPPEKRGSPAPPSRRTTMRTVSSYASAIMTAAITALASGAYAQNSQLTVPNVTVTAPAAPVEPPYMRDPWKAYGRNPYFGRYRVEEDKFVEVPCTATRIAVGASGKCLHGYRLTPSGSGSSSN